MSHLEKDVELLETAIEDIEEEIEEIIDFIDPSPEENGKEDGEGARANGKIEKARLQLTELLELIKNMKRDNKDNNHIYGRPDKSKKTRISMMEDIDRLKEELDAMQEDKEMMEEKLYEQGIKIRRLMEDNKELKKGGDGSGAASTAARGSAAGKARIDSESETEDPSKDSKSATDEDDSSGSDSDVQIEVRGQRLTPSQRIDNIIKRQTATLDDLFSKEDLHEELTARYGSRDHNLLAFFSRPTILTALIDTIVNIPQTSNDEGGGEKEIPPVPYTASEILTSGIQPLTDMLCQPSYLQKCFSLLDRPAPLPGSSPIASLWYKVMSHLLQVKSMELSVYIKDHNILPKVVNHISSECVLNLLLTMLNTEAKLETYGDEFQWSHLQLIELLAAKLDACAVTEATITDFPAVHHHTTALDNISEFLCEILTKYPFTSPLVLQMQEMPFVKRLVRNCFIIYPNENEGLDAANALYATRLRGPVHCLQILGHILSLSVNGGNYADIEMPPVLTELLNDGSPVENIPAPLHTIAAILHSFTQELMEPNVVSEKGNKNKILLGEYRMRVLMVAVGLARTGFFWSDHALLETGVLRSILSLFLTFPWNNVVHSMVTELVVSFLPPQSPLSRAGFCLIVLKDLHFLEDMLKIAKRSDGSSGLLGHLANLTTAIQRAAATTPSIQDCVSENQEEWSELVKKMANFNEISWKSS